MMENDRLNGWFSWDGDFCRVEFCWDGWDIDLLNHQKGYSAMVKDLNR
jgi:hypothetical protein